MLRKILFYFKYLTLALAFEFKGYFNFFSTVFCQFSSEMASNPFNSSPAATDGGSAAGFSVSASNDDYAIAGFSDNSAASKLKRLKRSYFGSYKGTRKEVGFCVVELVLIVKKETIRDELDSRNIIVNPPLILTYLTNANELF